MKMTQWGREAAVMQAAVAEMRRQGMSVTPEQVELALNEAKKRSATAQARTVENVYLTPDGKEIRVAAQREPQQYVTPKNPDGSGGQVIAAARNTRPGEQMFAEPIPYWLTSNTDQIPSSAAEAAALEVERRDLIAGLDGKSWVERTRDEQMIKSIDSRLHQWRDRDRHGVRKDERVQERAREQRVGE